MANRIFNFENVGEKVSEGNSISNSNKNINIKVNGKPEKNDLIVELSR